MSRRMVAMIFYERDLCPIFYPFGMTRSYAALRAADLDWIVGPGYRHRHKT